MKIRPTRHVLVLCMLVTLVAGACGEPNLLLGRWIYDAEASRGLAAAGAVISMDLSGVREIEFLDDKMVMGSQSESVSYELAGDRVIVTGPSGEGRVFNIIDENHIVLDKPTGRVAFQRAPPPVAASAEPGAQ